MKAIRCTVLPICTCEPVCFGACWVYPSDEEFGNGCTWREDIFHFLFQALAVLCAVLRQGANDEESMTRWHTKVFSSTLLLLKMKCVCGLTVISVAGGVCRPHQCCCASPVLGGQFLVGTLQSLGRIAGRRAGRGPLLPVGDRGYGSLRGSGCQYDASALDRNSCSSGQGVTISASLWHGPPRGKILSLDETVACGRLCSNVGAGILLAHPLPVHLSSPA